jgi:hypothetical protein
VEHVVGLSPQQTNRQIAVVVPWVVEDRWHNYLLHTQRSAVLRTRLFLQGNPKIVVADLPWYLGRENLVR